MKRFGFKLAYTLLIATLVLQPISALAEAGAPSGRVKGILSLMDKAHAPSSTSIDFDIERLVRPDTTEKVYAQNLISSKGDTLNIRFSFIMNREMSEAQWQTVKDWLKGIVLETVQTVQPDSRSLATVVADAYTQGRANAQPGDTGMPAWASEDLLLSKVTAVVPYYPQLSPGDNNQATQRLQEQLVTLGFLNDSADGKYGGNTEKAVMLLEDYVCLLEADAAQAGTDAGAVEEQGAWSGDGYQVLSAGGQGADAFTPATKVDGIADALLQAYLYSADFKAVRGTLRSGDQGVDVTRIQNRLNHLGYMDGTADGSYGSDTAYCLRLFQYYNGLQPTGVADGETQRMLFSARAVKPDHSLLKTGSGGDEVTKLQRRLRVLGFGSIVVDGSYGATTAAGVKNLQSYVSGTGILSDAIPNGVADPLLLDAFYAENFPEIPREMRPGDKGMDVLRLQRRLACLDYYYDAVDGAYGNGTEEAIRDFQRMHGISKSGIADAKTMKALFNANAKKALRPYMLRVSIADQRVYAYALDDNNEYTKLVRTMKCSTGRSGSPTPKGTYINSTGPGARWHYFKKFSCWAQYAYYIQGDIMFHSVLYGSKGGRVTQSSVNNLGRQASHGCVRLSVEDAKWIWTNCRAHTKVVVK